MIKYSVYFQMSVKTFFFQRTENLFLIAAILFSNNNGSVIEFKIIKSASEFRIILSSAVGAFCIGSKLNEYSAAGDIRSTVVRWSRK